MVKPIEEQNQRVVDIAKQICFNGALYAPYALLKENLMNPRKLARTIMTYVKKMIRYFCIILAVCGFLYIFFYIFAIIGLIHSNL